MTNEDPLGKIIRPIVEGQIRGFLKEHPGIIGAVDWYKPRKDKGETFVNSLSKRIVRDLISGDTRVRLVRALYGISLEKATGLMAETPEGNVTLAGDGRPGNPAGPTVKFRFYPLETIIKKWVLR